jgi:flagellar hook-associated protein 2
MFNIDGLVSGFDTSSIIESLLGFQQAQIETFNSQKAEITTKQTSFKGIEAQLLTMQGSLGRLNRTVGSVFDSRIATSSNEEAIVATADSGAIASTYQLKVNSLATAHQIGSQGFATRNELVASGEITFKVGDRAEQTISIDQSNNTLEGFVTAINDQLDGLSASVVFDQGNDSYRVLLTSSFTGADNQIAVTTNMDAGTGVVPDFSGPAVQEAQNAVVTLGSGPGAIAAEYDSNTVDGLIDGVTLELKSTSPTTPVAINVDNDTEAAVEAVQGFVEDFNSIVDFINEQTRFNPETEQASPLLGERSASTIKNRLLTLVSDTVSNTVLGRLSRIGVDLNTEGKLEIDSDTLNKSLRGELPNVDPKEIRSLFGLNAKSDNAGIRFLGGSSRSQPSDQPYQIDITQAAEQARLTAATALASSVTIDDTNNTLQITVNGVASEPLSLAAGTYTPEELASHVETVINTSDSLGIHNVNVGVSSSNELVIQTEAYGSAAKLSSITGSASSLLGFDGTEGANGQNVSGFFIVNGQREVAKGSGQVLTGDPDNEFTADMRFEVTLTADQISAGVDSEINATLGVSGQLSRYIDEVLDADKGLLTTVNESFDARIASIDRSIERVEEITESKRQSLIEEFAALETTLNELQNTGSFISSQLSSMSSFGSAGKK